MRIGLVFDGVIINSGALGSRIAKRLYGVEIPPEEFAPELIFTKGYLTEEQYREVQHVAHNTRRNLPQVEGAIASIKKLIADGHEVFVVTRRKETEMAIALDWAMRHELSLPFISTFTNLEPERSGAWLLLDAFVTDNMNQFYWAENAVLNLILFSRKYNERQDEEAVATRVHNWEELYEYINELS